MEDEVEDSLEDYQTGPFCRHWYDPADCPICAAGCANCGHSGIVHDFEAPGECFECDDCPGWQDKEET